MLNVWIGNLGKYNEGELVGDWLELPKSKAEIDKFLKEEVGLNDEYEEYMINDYETDLPIHIFEYEDINKLNIWIYVKFLDTKVFKILSYLNLFQFLNRFRNPVVYLVRDANQI